MARKYDYGGDIARMLRDEKELDFDSLKPTYPEKDEENKAEYKTAVKIWERKINKFSKFLRCFITDFERDHIAVIKKCFK